MSMLGENIKCTADFLNKSHECEYLLANLTNLLVSLHLGQESYKIEIKQEYMTEHLTKKNTILWDVFQTSVYAL